MKSLASNRSRHGPHRRRAVRMLIGVTALAAFVAFLGRSDANGTVRSSTPTVQLHTLLITHGQDANVDLSSVSCVNPTFCIAVGTRHAPSDGPLGSRHLRFDGRSWSKMATPAIADAALNGVSCVSRAACVAVGQQVVSELVSSSPLIEELHGATWSVTASSSPAYFPVNANLLQAVSCLSATDAPPSDGMTEVVTPGTCRRLRASSEPDPPRVGASRHSHRSCAFPRGRPSVRLSFRAVPSIRSRPLQCRVRRASASRSEEAGAS